MGKDNASVAKSLRKSGFYNEGKSKSERISIINDVTTKPQRLEMVDKLFLTKVGRDVHNNKKIVPKGHVRYNNKTSTW